MVRVSVLEPSELGIVVETFPAPSGTPFNRHVERMKMQELGDLTCLFAWDGDRPVGYMIVRRPGRNGGLTDQAIALGCAEFGDVFVAELARNHGVGRSLMDAAEVLTASAGYDLAGFEAPAANPYNAAARRLYERRGYSDAGFGEFVSGYTYWDADGNPHRDEEPHRYLVKRLAPLTG